MIGILGYSFRVLGQDPPGKATERPVVVFLQAGEGTEGVQEEEEGENVQQQPANLTKNRPLKGSNWYRFSFTALKEILGYIEKSRSSEDTSQIKSHPITLHQTCGMVSVAASSKTKRNFTKTFCASEKEEV